MSKPTHPNFGFVWCRVVGHKPAWLDAIVPNPWAERSLQWRCRRCGKSITSRPPTVGEAVSTNKEKERSA